ALVVSGGGSPWPDATWRTPPAEPQPDSSIASSAAVARKQRYMGIPRSVVRIMPARLRGNAVRIRKLWTQDSCPHAFTDAAHQAPEHAGMPRPIRRWRPHTLPLPGRQHWRQLRGIRVGDDA